MRTRASSARATGSMGDYIAWAATRLRAPYATELQGSRAQARNRVRHEPVLRRVHGSRELYTKPYHLAGFQPLFFPSHEHGR